MLLAELLGGLIARVTDLPVLILAILAALFATKRVRAVVLFLVVLGIVLLIKIPAIARMAEILQIREPTIFETTAWYSIAILFWFAVVGLLRRILLSNKW